MPYSIQTDDDITIDNTSEATPDDVVSVPQLAYDGTTTILIEWYTHWASCGGGASPVLIVSLWDLVGAGTDLGRISIIQGTGSLQGGALYGAKRLTPSAGNHTYRIRASRQVVNGTIRDGFVRVTRV